MLPGITDAQESTAASPAPGLPDPLGIADFKNGVYSWGVTSLTASQVISNTGLISGGTGLVVPNASTPPTLLNQFRDEIFTCQFVIVAEFITDANTVEIVYTDNAPSSGDGAYVDLYSNGVGGGFAFEDHDGFIAGTDSRFDAFDGTTPSAAGLHKIAGRRVDAAIAISVDGSTQVVDTSPFIALPNTNDASPPGGAGATMTAVYVGGYNGAGSSSSVTVLSIKLYPTTVTAADLPTLSA